MGIGKLAAPSDSRPRGDAGLGAARADAVARLEALNAEFDAIVAASEGANLDDECDPEGATVAFERQRVAAMIADARRRLDELDAAELRLAAGGYGRCEDCGGAIPPERLEALPTTTRCVTCAARRR